MPVREIIYTEHERSHSLKYTGLQVKKKKKKGF